MSREFTLRPDLEESFGGATVVCGHQGESFDVGQALQDGGGKIVTDNDLLVGALDSLYDGGGRIFVSADTEDDPNVETPAPITQVPAPQGGQVSTPEDAAQHAEGSDYNTLTKAELLDVLEQRSLTAETGATKAELIEQLEAADQPNGE